MYESGVLLMTMAKQLEFELLLKGGLSGQISLSELSNRNM